MIGSTIVTSHEDGLDKLARHARFVLIVLAAVQLAGLAFLYIAMVPMTPESMTGPLLVGVAFVALAMWAREAPLPAVGTGLAIYLLGVAIAAAIDPISLTEGLAFKAIVAVLFYNGIMAALAYNKMAREYVPPVAAPPREPKQYQPPPRRRRGK
jgi:hypothetical protein